MPEEGVDVSKPGQQCVADDEENGEGPYPAPPILRVPRMVGGAAQEEAEKKRWGGEPNAKEYKKRTPAATLGRAQRRGDILLFRQRRPSFPAGTAATPLLTPSFF